MKPGLETEAVILTSQLNIAPLMSHFPAKLFKIFKYYIMIILILILYYITKTFILNVNWFWLFDFFHPWLYISDSTVQHIHNKAHCMCKHEHTCLQKIYWNTCENMWKQSVNIYFHLSHVCMGSAFINHTTLIQTKPRVISFPHLVARMHLDFFIILLFKCKQTQKQQITYSH